MSTTKPKSSKKIKKIITVSVILLVLVILAFIFLPNLLAKSRAASTSITTYNVTAVSYGDVDTTISGSGNLTPITKENITSSKAVTVTAVNYTVGSTVEEDAIIATATDSDGNTVEFAAPYECVLLELPIAVDSEISAGGQVAMIMGTDGFTLSLAVDENDIKTVEMGQEVTFTIDSLNEEYEGSVTAISYNGSSNGGSTAFQITVTVDYIEGVYPSMSASAEIVIESSGDGLLVPVDAVQTSGDNNYVYLAPSGSTEGDVYEEGELSLSDLTKVYVETDMSDGSYILIESDELSEGSLIVVATLTSTLTGSESEGQEGFGGGMGGFGGGMGGFGGQGGKDFGDFDFESFDPSSMPQGGFGGMGM